LDFMFIEISPINMPFLPRFHLHIDNFIARLTLLYLIYFWGALLYWYLVYRISQKIINIGTKKYINWRNDGKSNSP
jgi:hypothetical protein